MAQKSTSSTQNRVLLLNQENVYILIFSFIYSIWNLCRSSMLYIFNMVMAKYSLKDSFFYPYTAYCDSGIKCQILCSLLIVTRYEVGKHLSLSPSGVITKCIQLITDFMLVKHFTYCCITVLTRASQLSTAIHGCIYDFRFGLYHVAVAHSYAFFFYVPWKVTVPGHGYTVLAKGD